MRAFTAVITGFCAGLIGSLAGLGGGVIMVPMLVWLSGLTQHRAHGTSLMALVATGMAGAAAYWRDGAVDFSAALWLAAPAVLTAGAGARFAGKTPEWGLKRYFGYFLLAVAFMLLCKPYFPRSFVAPEPGAKAAVLAVTGAITGFLAGMMGVGGGSIMVPSMVLLAGMGQHAAQGTSLLAMVPAGAAGAAEHWRLGNVDRWTVWRLLPGIAIGAYLGGRMAGMVDESWLRRGFAVMVIYSGIRYVRSRPPSRNSG